MPIAIKIKKALINLRRIHPEKSKTIKNGVLWWESPFLNKLVVLYHTESRITYIAVLRFS